MITFIYDEQTRASYYENGKYRAAIYGVSQLDGESVTWHGAIVLIGASDPIFRVMKPTFDEVAQEVANTLVSLDPGTKPV